MRSLELATRAFQDSLLSRAAKPSHDWHVQPVVKDRIPVPPERWVSVEPAIPPSGTACPRNLCISYGRVRRVETNLSNLPQPFTLCQSSSAQNAIFYRHAALLRRFSTTKILGISYFPNLAIFNREIAKFGKMPWRLIKILFFGGCCDLQNPSETDVSLRRNCSEFTLALAPGFAF